jgi:3-phytase
MRAALVFAAAAVAGCATTPVVQSLPAATVSAIAETTPVGTVNDDAADDSAIWRNPADPAKSLIVATDKKAGLYLHALDGKVLGFDPAGLLNNVDLIDLGPRGVIVAASDRNDPGNAKIRLYRLDTAAQALVPLAIIPGGSGEGYGICMARAGEAVDIFSVLQQGTIEQVQVTLDGPAPTGRTVRRFAVNSQPEGCVVDERTSHLYVGEEIVGIWRFDSRAEGTTAGTLVAKVDGKHLVADVEGLALAPAGADGGYLIASSQGDNAYTVYRLPDVAYAGRFRIAAGKVGATEETDGIALALGDFGPAYPAGVFVAQDGKNAPAAQNFKFVSWADVVAALGLTAP